jgi:hypothetical protein
MYSRLDMVGPTLLGFDLSGSVRSASSMPGDTPGLCVCVWGGGTPDAAAAGAAGAAVTEGAATGAAVW